MRAKIQLFSPFFSTIMQLSHFKLYSNLIAPNLQEEGMNYSHFCYINSLCICSIHCKCRLKTIVCPPSLPHKSLQFYRMPLLHACSMHHLLEPFATVGLLRMPPGGPVSWAMADMVGNSIFSFAIAKNQASIYSFKKNYEYVPY